MMTLLSRAHQQLDRLYWPAMLADAELLLDKENTREAVAALHQVLSLNPRCAEAWYMLGRVVISRFDFDSAASLLQAKQCPLRSKNSTISCCQASRIDNRSITVSVPETAVSPSHPRML